MVHISNLVRLVVRWHHCCTITTLFSNFRNIQFWHLEFWRNAVHLLYMLKKIWIWIMDIMETLQIMATMFSRIINFKICISFVEGFRKICFDRTNTFCMNYNKTTFCVLVIADTTKIVCWTKQKYVNNCVSHFLTDFESQVFHWSLLVCILMGCTVCISFQTSALILVSKKFAFDGLLELRLTVVTLIALLRTIVGDK